MVGLLISIHALVKRATSFHTGLVQYRQYFNPRPREEGDVKRIDKAANQAISIHALVKRATFCCKICCFCHDISIHALVKRATMILKQQKLPQKISIHALVKRATNICGYENKSYYISIHALVKRATRRLTDIQEVLTIFQSTPS